MKNIHVLPTEKPSKLRVHKCGQLFLSINFIYEINDENKKHIYITSDQEIKHLDWVYDAFDKTTIYRATAVVIHNIKSLEYPYCKKIILTTDQDLIKDGVQAIDDEFLEWFVKNPSCEFVEVKPLLSNNGRALFGYKIIIPKEEPTIEDEYLKDELKKYDGIDVVVLNKPEEPKQETLEEAFKYFKEEYPILKSYNLHHLLQVARFGAKWQQEQDKNKYSEEDMKEAFKNGAFKWKMHSGGKCFEEWFEQFKNK